MKMELVNLSKKFGDVYAVKNVSLAAEDGELVALLGPSGCGKTTTLLSIAGVYRPTEGEILFNGLCVNKMQPKERDIGMVFQSYALYPHMNAYQNIVFSLVLRKRPKDEMERAAKRVSEMLGIGHLLKRKAAELSGGQQQRVALARALIKEPKLLLFDEPLSNLDARLRLSMREEIKRLQVQLGITSIYVTHDQVEAMTMADRVAVMHDGELLAYVPPEELHERPRTEFIATFIGSPSMNLADVTVDNTGGSAHAVLKNGVSVKIPKERLPRMPQRGNAVRLGIRPEDVSVVAERSADVQARVTFVESLGRENLVVCDVGGQRIQCLTGPGQKPPLDSTVGLKLDMSRAHYFDPESQVSLLWEN